MLTAVVERCSPFGQSFLFLLRILVSFPRRREHFQGVVEQIFRLGNETLLIILVAGAFIGMVISLQGYISLAKYGAELEIGGLTAYSVYRELGPVVTGLMFAGRVGSLLSAEIGLMQINQQFMCLDMLGIDANRLVLFPRFFGGIVAVPILNIMFCLSAVLSSYLVCSISLDLPAGMFWNSLEYQTLFMVDFVHGVWKSFLFGVVIVWIALYQGMYTEKDRLGLARATTTTVVSSSLYLLAIDYVITAFSGGVV